MNYSNTNEKLYDDIALWEKTDGRDLFAQMQPGLPERSSRKSCGARNQKHYLNQ